MGRRARTRLGGWALVACGVALLLDGVLMLTWQEPLGALRQARAQAGLEERLAQQERRWAAVTGARLSAMPAAAGTDAPPLVPLPGASPARTRLSPLPQLATRPSSTALRTVAGRFGAQLEEGAPVGRLRIPSLGVDEIVVHGVRDDLLQRAPGHYPQTRLPGQGGTVGIAGHRTTYGAPLRDADDLRAGDTIELRMPYGTYRYAVTGTRIVAPAAVEVLRSRAGRERLVLTTCHPLHSSSERLVVLARRA